jgi:hypothetical protein
VKKTRREQARKPPTPRRRSRYFLVVLGALTATVAIVIGVAVWRGSAEEPLTFADLPRPDPGPVHVHGLGVNPADDALFIATHTGLFRVGSDATKAERVGARSQDTMGFTIIGSDRFLGSGHPDINEAREKGLPALLGLIESRDAGRTWTPISLSGEADFHVLRFAGNRVYGYDASNDRLLASADRGRTWDELGKPGPIIDLVAAPDAPNHVLTTSSGGLPDGLYESRNGGRTWDQVTGAIGLLAWPAPDRLYLVATDGQVFLSRDGGRRLDRRGQIGGEPAALLGHGRDLYAALHDGTIKRSTDGGAKWTVRSEP